MSLSDWSALFLFFIQMFVVRTDLNYDYNVCSCDLQLLICDINCCCDKDCSEEDVLIFSTCTEILPQFEYQPCTHPVTMYSIYNSLKTTENSSSLFCISRDNNYGRNIYSNAEYELNFRDKYDHLKNVIDPDYSSLIPIEFLFSNDSVVFGLPYSMFSNLCDSKTAITFLQDYTHECVQYLPNLPNDCSVNEEISLNSYRTIYFLDDTDKISYLFCEHDLNYCDKGFISSFDLTNNFTNNICKNMVEEVHYFIFFTVPDTIDHLVVKFILKEKRYLNKPIYFKQKFSVQFKLSNDLDETELSGNPGYIENKFILAGWLEENHIEYNTNPWFQIPSIGFEENCLTANSNPLLFGENVISTCVVNIDANDTEKCRISQLSKLILYKNLPTHIGSYGNSNPYDLTDWVPLHYPNLPIEFTSSSCSNYVSAVHIDIVYAYIGLENNRQAKIIGAKAEFGIGTEISACLKYESAISFDMKIPFFISVAFTDVTVDPITVFAPVVVFDIKVPYDFFYPFISHNAESKLRHKNFVLFIMLIFILILLI